MASNKDSLREQQEKLAQQERTTGHGGVIPRLPKEHMLDARDVEAMHPDKHLRWVNIRNNDKTESRKTEGYARLAESEGGRNIGSELALFGVPQAQYEARVAQQEARTAQLSTAHRREVEQAAERAARELRDRHGVRVRERDLIVNDE